jgi:hypothetical protein
MGIIFWRLAKGWMTIEPVTDWLQIVQSRGMLLLDKL